MQAGENEACKYGKLPCSLLFVRLQVRRAPIYPGYQMSLYLFAKSSSLSRGKGENDENKLSKFQADKKQQRSLRQSVIQSVNQSKVVFFK